MIPHISAISNVPAPSPATRLKAEKAAQDFESVMLGSLLESLQKTSNSEDGSTVSDNYSVMRTQALAASISAHGGIGIAHMILRQWQQTKVPELRTPEVTP